MSNGIYTATGQVIDRDTNEGVAKLSVEAWDTNTQRAQAALGKAATDDNGRFSITLDLKKLQYEQAPDLSGVKTPGPGPRIRPSAHWGQRARKSPQSGRNLPRPP